MKFNLGSLGGLRERQKLTERLEIYKDKWLATEGHMAPLPSQGHVSMSRDIFGCHHGNCGSREGMLLASSE